jgi:hypothetical protein
MLGRSMRRTTLALVLLALPCGARAAEGGRTILYDDVATELPPGLPKLDDVWLTTDELTQATRFVLKPEGVCREELCFPVPKARKDEFLRTVAKKTWFNLSVAKTTWFNLSAFGRLLKQPVARDEATGVFYFGPRADQQNAHLQSLLAPDFTLPDKDGRKRSLSEFRGRKVLLVTWASW